MTLRRILGNLAKSLDSSAIGSYLSKGASETDFRAILYSEISGTPSVVGDSAVATAIVDSAYVQARQGSTTGLTNIDSAASLAILDSDYMQSRITGGGVGFKVYHFETTNGQTTFQDSDADGDVLGYTENGILVFKNGVLLLDSSDYTASDGTSVVLTSGTDSGELVSIAKWSLGGGAAAWYGDRGVIMGGANAVTAIEYFDITTTGNTSSFGDLSVKHTSGPAGCGDGTYGVIGGGEATTNPDDLMEYVTIATTGNASTFGNLTQARRLFASADDAATYGIFAGGFTGSRVNTIDYITVASPGNATDFGDLGSSVTCGNAVNDATYAVISGYSTPTSFNTIEYITVASPGNATDFGDLTVARTAVGGVKDGTYGVFGGGWTGSVNSNVIDYITIASPGNATDFGDLSAGMQKTGGISNSTRGVFIGGGGGNEMQYITIATPGNTTDFGDMSNSRGDNPVGVSGSPS